MRSIMAGRKASTGVVSFMLSVAGLMAPALSVERPEEPGVQTPVTDLAQMLAPLPMFCGLLGLVTALVPVVPQDEEAAASDDDQDGDPLAFADGMDVFP